MADNSGLPFVRKKSNPELQDLLDYYLRDAMLQTNCHAIATIESFNSDLQTVSAKMVYKQTYIEKQQNGEYKPIARDYPILVDCPIISLYGGDAGVTLPIKTGDTCLILFNDRDIDNWFAGNNNGVLNTPRLHSFSDGIALVGLRSKQKSKAGYETDKLDIFKGDSHIRVGSKINIQNAAENLGPLLGELITLLANLTITVSSGSSAGAWPVTPAQKVQIEQIKARLEGLLE